jgi:hypothetical protein
MATLAGTLIIEYGGVAMADEQSIVGTLITQQPSESELMAKLEAALKSKDFKEVAIISVLIAKAQRGKEAAELTAKQNALVAITDEVKRAISAALKPLVDAKKLDLADGVWFTQDFGENLVTCRLMKSQAKAPRASGNGGGAGKKFSISTNDMLTKHANEMYKDTGQTLQEVFDMSSDKNSRFGVRQALLKLEGLI